MEWDCGGVGEWFSDQLDLWCTVTCGARGKGRCGVLSRDSTPHLPFPQGQIFVLSTVFTVLLLCLVGRGDMVYCHVHCHVWCA